MIKKQRGTADILPSEMLLWQYIEKTMREEAALYGFEETRFPTFEATELFSRGVGGTTDVVQKEMYTFEDRDGRSISLRPEGTAGVARSVLENGLLSGAMPLKLYYIANFFRYEKPQAGRSREFYQFGTEMFGAPDAAADFTVISMADTFIKKLGIKNTALHINSIGCPECRPKYREKLVAYLRANESELCDTCRTRLEANPLRILDCKNESCRRVAEGAPRTVDNLCDDCRAHMDKLEKCLKSSGTEYRIDPHIVRGLDYYTRTVFEFIAEDIGAQSTICGGGRYDGLVKELGGPDMPAVGFAMGISRLILAMEQSGALDFEENVPELYIASMGDGAQLRAIEIVSDLRKNGICAECDIVGRSLKAQMKYADKIGARYTLILGDSELESGRAQLKNMSDSTQTEIALGDVASHFGCNV